MRLSFTITTTNFWRPDMNDCGLGMRTTFAISPAFPTLAFALVALLVRYHPPHIFHTTAGKNLSRKISRSRRPFFLSPAPPHCLCDDTRSLSVRLSYAQHKSPRHVVYIIFLSLFSGSGTKLSEKKRCWWKLMCLKLCLNSPTSTEWVEVTSRLECKLKFRNWNNFE